MRQGQVIPVMGGKKIRDGDIRTLRLFAMEGEEGGKDKKELRKIKIKRRDGMDAAAEQKG